MMKEKRVPLKYRTLENDINYKAPLSYRYLRMIAWFFIIVAQIGLVAKLNIKVIPTSEAQIGWLRNVGEFCSALPLPLFMLANFAIIFQKKGNWKYLLTFFGGIALILYLLGNFVVIHFGYGFINALAPIDFMSVAKGFGFFLFNLGNTGQIFNIFIDLFLCSLLFFFMNYTPKNSFKGNKVYIFRSLIAIPILWEVASIVIKFLIGAGMMDIPFFAFFLLTSKPPFIFIAFLALVIILKIQERVSYKKTMSHDFMIEHRKTNAHSFRFSLIIAIVFVACALIDLLVYAILGASFEFQLGADNPYAREGAQYIVDHMGFGRSLVLLIVAPLALLFSYTKTHKNKKVDLFIPIGGIVCILIVWLEGTFQIATHHIANLIEKLEEFLNGLAE